MQHEHGHTSLEHAGTGRARCGTSVSTGRAGPPFPAGWRDRRSRRRQDRSDQRLHERPGRRDERSGHPDRVLTRDSRDVCRVRAAPRAPRPGLPNGSRSPWTTCSGIPAPHRQPELVGPRDLGPPRRVQRERQAEHPVGAQVGRGPAGHPRPVALARQHERAGQASPARSAGPARRAARPRPAGRDGGGIRRPATPHACWTNATAQPPRRSPSRTATRSPPPSRPLAPWVSTTVPRARGGPHDVGVGRTERGRRPRRAAGCVTRRGPMISPVIGSTTPRSLAGSGAARAAAGRWSGCCSPPGRRGMP